MKNHIYIIAMFLACLTLACDDKTEEFKGPYSLVVTGSTTVAPGASETYRLAPYAKPETYTWTVAGPAQIVGATTGLVVKVKFMSVGKVTLTVTNGVDKEIIPITVEEVEPVATVTLNGSGVLKDNAKDTVFLSFPAPLVANPTIAMLTSTTPSEFIDDALAFQSGTLGPIVKIDASNYYAIYTAGTGNGTPEAIIKGMTSTSDFGSVTVDTTYIQLYRVDNVAPIANLSYSTTKVNDGTVVTVTATFSEPVTFKSSLDSAILISFSGAGVAAETDTLQPTDNPLVYTYDYTVNGSGNGTITATLSNIVDLGRNDLATTINTTSLVVDNITPTVTGLATDGGDFASLKITSTESGTTWYVIQKDGDPAPSGVGDFSGGVASGSAPVDAATQITLASILASGTYDVYFISQDETGNYSSITTVPLVMN